MLRVGGAGGADGRRGVGADLGPRDVGVAANLAKLAGGQTGGALVESVTAPLTMTQHGWDKLYAEYKESGE